MEIERREVGLAARDGEDRSQQVVGERLDDGGERRPDGDADGEVDDVAPQDEGLEVLDGVFHGGTSRARL